jgi:hypothetical protein
LQGDFCVLQILPQTDAELLRTPGFHTIGLNALKDKLDAYGIRTGVADWGWRKLPDYSGDAWEAARDKSNIDSNMLKLREKVLKELGEFLDSPEAAPVWDEIERIIQAPKLSEKDYGSILKSALTSTMTEQFDAAAAGAILQRPEIAALMQPLAHALRVAAGQEEQRQLKERIASNAAKLQLGEGPQ